MRQTLFFLSLALFVLCQTEAEAIHDIHTVLEPYSWRNYNHSLLTIEEYCKFTNVGCLNNHVIHLYLDYNNMNGAIPRSINNLVYLQTLYMNDNRITGDLPDMSALTQLKSLDLSKITINEGAIPNWICNLTLLQQLRFNDAQLTGVIPDCLHKFDLTHLNLADNDLQGAVEPFIKMPNLRFLDLSNNPNLYESNPEFLCADTTSSLVTLKLANSNLKGELKDCSNSTINELTYIDLSSNSISGVIPTQYFASLKGLVTVNLGSNKLEGTFNASLASSCDVSYNKLDCEVSDCGCKYRQNYNGYDPKYSSSKNAVIITCCVLSAVAFIGVFGFFFYREYFGKKNNEYEPI